ncbi:hypothetical protein [Rhodopirellula bahusiensis]|uniref:Uncharacterized protein n=1 Tax=Rhodopirellula bahusiensis TaxID=2014065 RepID=A0A2G1W6Y2_9BACT|nr:hypothetical protein [Rhodopirellula bahusiensis]PHQ34792.1 hypothetical protein CEE69_13025 [Rhodopirellula bahusiensis]
MQRWGIEPIDWLASDSGFRGKLSQDKSISLQVCNEAAIGLAFATIKMRAECRSDVAEYGLAALKRTGRLIDSSTLSEALKSEWKAAEKKMVAKLKAHQT